MAGQHPPPHKRCTAKCKATGKWCRAWAVNGFPVCTKHGAGTHAHPGGSRPKHGLYSKRGAITLPEALRRFRDNPSIVDLKHHIAGLHVLRDRGFSIMEDYETRLTELTGPLSAEARTELMKMQTHIAQVLDKLCAAIERWHRVVHGEKVQVISIAMVEPMLDAVDNVLDQFVPKDKRNAASDRLSDLLAEITLPL